MEFKEGPFFLFKSSGGLAEFIVRIINDRTQDIVKTVNKPKKPFGRVSKEQLDKLVTDSGLSRSIVARNIGLDKGQKKTLDRWFRKPSSLTLDNFTRIAVECAEAAYGDPRREDAVYLDLMEILVPRMTAKEELEVMRASAVRRISSIASVLSDADLASLLDHAVALDPNGVRTEGHQAPPSKLLREASDMRRAEAE